MSTKKLKAYNFSYYSMTNKNIFYFFLKINYLYLINFDII